MPEAPWGRHNRWLTVITVDPGQFGATRDDVRLALEAENIESRPVWKPMHLQPVFNPQIASRPGEIRFAPHCREFHGVNKGAKAQKRYRIRVIGGSVAEDLFERGLCLPSGTQMTEEDLDRVISVVLSCKR